MTDKEKIREEVEKLKSQLLRSACSSQIAMETMCKEEAYNEILAILDSMQEEPVSEELEEAADNALSNVLNTHEIVNVRSCLEMFRYGAKWQAEQFEKNRLAACDRQAEEEAEVERDFVMGIIENEHRQPTFDDAIKYGMRLQKEKMMTKSIEAVVSQVPCSNEIIFYNPSSVDKYYLPQEMNKLGLNKGDKVKLIIIKED